jgi:hypothetical protein
MSEEKIHYRDKFGNKVTIYTLTDGSFRKETQTNKSTEFEFLGDTYSYRIICASRHIKEYWETSHSVRSLVKDKYGRLFHYRYDEEMRFDGDADREDSLWTFVQDEKDSDQLTSVGNLSLLREPYIASDETDWVAAHEYVDKHFVNKLTQADKFSIKPLMHFLKAILHR